jgi:N-methylhydantoinase A/oxoprolinase/acetone carboxylase beta subunit
MDRDRLPAGEACNGPLLIEEGGTTTLVPEGWSVELDAIGCLLMRRS